jgi:hypothetical protein
MQAAVEDEGDGETLAITISFVIVLLIAPIIADTKDEAYWCVRPLIVEGKAIVVSLFSPQSLVLRV